MEHTVLDENGATVIVVEPFYDARKRAWLGEPMTRDNPENPPHEGCGDTPSLIHVFPHLDSSNLFHYTVFQCRVCGEEFNV